MENKGNIVMEKVELDVYNARYTQTMQESDFKFNAPHQFAVIPKNDPKILEEGATEPLQIIKFQEGPIKESGVNGVMNEDLLAMVITRLQHFQKSEFACRENAVALTKLEEAMMWLDKRTTSREKKGIEGTHQVKPNSK